MNEHQIRSAMLAVILMLLTAVASAQSLEQVLGVRGQTTKAGVRSQLKINELSTETRDLLTQYKMVMKVVNGLIVYNKQQRKLIKNQEIEMVDLNQSIENVAQVERLITPLIARMISTLEKFVELDVPFLLSEREQRLKFLNEMMDRPDVLVSEKFSQVMQAYQVENSYGSTIEAYTDVIEIEGKSRQVDMLRFGRVSLVFQTTDSDITGVWDNNNKQWVELGDDYRSEVRDGLRMARKTATPNLIRLPVVAPGPGE